MEFSSFPASLLSSRRRPENIVNNLNKTIDATQSQIKTFNKREANLPGWVQDINKKFRISNSAHLKPLTEPKHQNFLLNPQFNPPLTKVKKAVSKTSIFSPSTVVTGSNRKFRLLNNASTVTNLLKTENSEIIPIEKSKIKSLIDQKSMQLQFQWSRMNNFRQKYQMNNIRKLGKSKVDKIIAKVIERKRPISAVIFLQNS